MIDLYRMMMQAQGGDAMANLARQFGVSQAQAQAAMEAMLPAFSTGLKRNTDDPMGLNSFLKAVGSGNHLNYYEDAMAAFSPMAYADGNGILGHLFGDKDVSRAVAAQAAAASGLGETLIKKMLPVIASMIMGGLFKQMSGSRGGQGGFLETLIENMMKGGMGGSSSGRSRAGADNPLGDLLEGMLGGGKAGGSKTGGSSSGSRGGGAANPLEDLIEGMLGGKRGGSSGGGAGDNPLGDIFDQMLGGGQRRAEPEPAPAPEPRRQTRRAEPKPEPAPRQRQQAPSANPFEDILDQMFGGGRSRQAEPDVAADEPPAPAPRGKDIFGEMFDSGRKVQKQYQKNIDDIFDSYLDGMNQRR